MSTVYILNPLLPCNVVEFVNKFQLCVNDWSMVYILKLKTNSMFLKLMKFVHIVVEEYLLFGEIRPFVGILRPAYREHALDLS